MKVGDLVTISRRCTSPRAPHRCLELGELGLITGEVADIGATDGHQFFVLFSSGVERVDPYFIAPAADSQNKKETQ